MPGKSTNNTARMGNVRTTPIRAALLDILTKSKTPLTPQELLEALAKRKLQANKTTVYRQLESLHAYSIIEEIRFTDRIARYELRRENQHHHHLVCVQCGRIEDIFFPTELEAQEKMIWKKRRFKVHQHSLEFFGVCRTCQTKT